jgi:hypothetical protein
MGAGKDTEDIDHVVFKIGDHVTPHMVCSTGFNKTDRSHSPSFDKL